MQQYATIPAKRMIFIVAIALLFIAMVASFQSCKKYLSGGVNPPSSRGSIIISEVWGLTSATSIAPVSTGTLISYKGMPADSLIFAWTLNPNVDIYGINSFIGGANTQYSIAEGRQCSNVSLADTSTIASDTIILANQWKQNYSDTLFVTKTSPTQLVFNVRYSLPIGSGVEVDSFHTVRYF